MPGPSCIGPEGRPTAMTGSVRRVGAARGAGGRPARQWGGRGLNAKAATAARVTRRKPRRAQTRLDDDAGGRGFPSPPLSRDGGDARLCVHRSDPGGRLDGRCRIRGDCRRPLPRRDPREGSGSAGPKGYPATALGVLATAMGNAVHGALPPGAGEVLAEG